MVGCPQGGILQTDDFCDYVFLQDAFHYLMYFIILIIIFFPFHYPVLNLGHFITRINGYTIYDNLCISSEHSNKPAHKRCFTLWKVMCFSCQLLCNQWPGLFCNVKKIYFGQVKYFTGTSNYGLIYCRMPHT